MNALAGFAARLARLAPSTDAAPGTTGHLARIIQRHAGLADVPWRHEPYRDVFEDAARQLTATGVVTWRGDAFPEHECGGVMRVPVVGCVHVGWPTPDRVAETVAIARAVADTPASPDPSSTWPDLTARGLHVPLLRTGFAALANGWEASGTTPPPPVDLPDGWGQRATVTGTRIDLQGAPCAAVARKWAAAVADDAGHVTVDRLEVTKHIESLPDGVAWSEASVSTPNGLVVVGTVRDGLDPERDVCLASNGADL